MAGHLYVILVTLLAASVLVAKSRANEIIYVNAAATGANDGTSWPDAFLDLQDALDDAASEPPANLRQVAPVIRIFSFGDFGLSPPA